MRKNHKIFTVGFLLPAVTLYTLFLIVPILFSLYTSFTEWHAGVAPVLNGISNYIRILKDPNYWKVLFNTFKLIGLSLVLQVPMGVILAYLIFRASKGAAFFRTAYFVPVIIAPVAIATMFVLIYNGDIGPLNKILELVGLESWTRSWLSDKGAVLYSVIFPQVWQYVGFFTVITLAALKTIPLEIFESAKIDGAGSFRVFFNLVLPLIWGVIIIDIILCITGSFKSFDHSWIMTKGGPGVQSAYITIYMYKMAFTMNNFGVANAITVTIMTLSIGATIFIKKVFSSKGEV
ncbi:MAG: sugar ABC transporter permease [Spirochaetaceae bacterium]|nr:sugar ABC transporter permease [Spirochaetaceae bacterium]